MENFPFQFTAERHSELANRIVYILTKQAGLMQGISSQQNHLNSLMGDLREDLGVLENRDGPGIPSAATLTKCLGLHNVAFDLSLELSQAVPNPICKGKYFTFTVDLVPSAHYTPQDASIYVSIYIFSAELRPKLISVNMAGKPILFGPTTLALQYDPGRSRHSATFRLKFNEVTSHFKNGWVFFTVLPEEHNPFLLERGYTLEPLIVEHLVCKSKEITCSRWRQKMQDA